MTDEELQEGEDDEDLIEELYESRIKRKVDKERERRDKEENNEVLKILGIQEGVL